MTLTTEQIIELMKDGSNFYTDTVLTFDAMRDRINKLEERIKSLEEARKPLKLVQNDGNG
jgi:phage shock protein A